MKYEIQASFHASFLRQTQNTTLNVVGALNTVLYLLQKIKQVVEIFISHCNCFFKNEKMLEFSCRGCGLWRERRIAPKSNNFEIFFLSKNRNSFEKSDIDKNNFEKMSLTGIQPKILTSKLFWKMSTKGINSKISTKLKTMNITL